MSRRTDMSVSIRLLLVPLLAAGFVMGVGTPAIASCATPPKRSAFAFTGTVTSVERDGLIARVTRDDGKRVVVRGTLSDTGITTTDRTYVNGARYEFHPLNGTSPYQDNACTATRRLPRDPNAQPAGPERSEPQSGFVGGGTAVGLGAFAIVLFAGLVGLLIWHRRKQRSHPTPPATVA